MREATTPVYVLGDAYPALVTALTEAGATLVSHPEQAAGVVVSFGGAPDELERVLTECPGVSWIQLPSAGIEAFAASLTAHPNKRWTSAKGAYALPVAEHALALTLALLRELPARAAARSWEPASGTSLHGLRVTVVGAGGVALEIVRLMKCFRTTVTVVRRRPEVVAQADATVTDSELTNLLPQTDVLVLAAAATPQTRKLIDGPALARLPERAIVVNIGRGSLIDTDALVAALRSGALAGAALDVTDPEPLPDGHPLWHEPRALITPHTADTLEMIQPLFAARAADNVARSVAGEAPVGLVDAAAGY